LWRRYFHWTSKLDYWERIWLYFESADYFARVRLNGVELGEHEGALDPFAFPITPLLQKRNCLEVELEVPETPAELLQHKWMVRETPACNDGPALLGEVRLEVFHPVRFGELAVWSELGEDKAFLHIHGDILAEAQCQPELYVVYDNHTLHYQRIEVAAGRQSFTLRVACPRVYLWDVGEGTPAALHYVQVELADRSVLLDARYCHVGFRRLRWDRQKGKFQLNKQWLTPETEVPLVDIQSPLAEGKPFEQADEIGQPLLCRLPVRGGYSVAESFRQRAVGQIVRLVQLLQHHPSILGWIVHTEPSDHDRALDAALFQAIQQTDPSRPAFLQPRADTAELIPGPAYPD
jgi:beta-galactosidase/beta-glucuronidase